MRHLFGILFLIVLISVILYAISFAGWTEPVRISEPGGCLYPQILAQGDTLHVVYENAMGYEKISYVRSTDAGETWSEHVVLSERNGVAETPRIMGGQRLIVLWEQIFNGGAHRFDIGYARSSDAGSSWDSTQYLFDPNWDSIGGFTASGSDSLVNIVFGSQQGPVILFFYLSSIDFGESWSLPREIFGAYQLGRADCVALDSLLHFSWSGRFDTSQKSEIYYTCSRNGGEDWTPNIALSVTDQFHSQIPAIDADRIGQVGLTWMDYKYSPYISTGDIFLRQSLDCGNTWGPESMLTYNHLAVKSDIVLSGDTIVVAWEDRRPENGQRSIYCNISFDGGGTWDEPTWLDVDTMESRYPSLAMSNGRIYAIWYDTRCDPDSQNCAGIYFSKFPAEPTDVDGDDESLPTILGLSAYPNPFNSSTTISLSSLKGGELTIFNVAGQRVRTFEIQAGVDKITWDATDAAGEGIASGVYFARFVAGGNSRMVKLVYLK